jgi:N-acetylglutamate synthase-like GNAT family acetyltransferase
MDEQHFKTRKAVSADLDQIKFIAEKEKKAFGFITRGTIKEAILLEQIMVIEDSQRIVGFQHYYHRKRDLQTTFYHKAILEEFRGKGLGKQLVDAVVDEAKKLGRLRIILKCPIDLPSKAFHEAYGFVKVRVEDGRKRKLNVWQFDIHQ